MDAQERTYYLRRILQEQEAARVAKSAEARERHEELAAAYQLRCRVDAQLTAMKAPPPTLEVDFAA